MWPITLACLYLAIAVLALWRAVRQLGWHDTVAQVSPAGGDEVGAPPTGGAGKYYAWCRGALAASRHRRSGDGRRPLRSAPSR